MTHPRPTARIAGVCLAVGLAAATAAQAQSQAQQARLVPAQSEISFSVKQMGVPIEGRFRKFDARLAFDPKQPQAGRVSIAIDAASASFGIVETDAELPKAPWFDSARFPQASFESTAIRALAPGRLEVAGRLAVKGGVREVTVPVALAQAGGVTTATGAFTIRRLDFRIGEGEWADTSMVANDVVVKFRLAFNGVAPL